MIELPEALTLSKELGSVLFGKTVEFVRPPTKEHRFCWWNGEPGEYEKQLSGARLTGSEGFGIFVELAFDNGKRLCVNDGVNLRVLNDAPKDYQLLIGFSGGTLLAFTVAMYGGIILHGGDYDNDYYLKSRAYVSPFSPEFEERYYATLAACKPNLSAKAFLATEQRFPGIGNGALQDILFDAGINPRRKLSSLSDAERAGLLKSTVSVLRDMTESGGRDTEKDIYGSAGGYTTKMSKNTLKTGCPACGGQIVKETYLGGSVYYCPACQPLT